MVIFLCCKYVPFFYISEHHETHRWIISQSCFWSCQRFSFYRIQWYDCWQLVKKKFTKKNKWFTLQVFLGVENYYFLIFSTMQVVSNPWQFDVLVLTNLQGLIVSNLLCGLIGGPGKCFFDMWFVGKAKYIQQFYL